MKQSLRVSLHTDWMHTKHAHAHNDCKQPFAGKKKMRQNSLFQKQKYFSFKQQYASGLTVRHRSIAAFVTAERTPAEGQSPGAAPELLAMLHLLLNLPLCAPISNPFLIHRAFSFMTMCDVYSFIVNTVSSVRFLERGHSFRETYTSQFNHLIP